MSLSLTFCNACSEIVHTGKRVTDRISVVVVRGGNRHGVSSVRVSLKRIYRLVIVASISNLRTMAIVCKLWQYVM
jgi:hypothetical protein